MTSLVNYFYERRRGLAKTAGVFGGLYIAGSYVARRLEEVRDRMYESRAARDNLRRRFQQNQQDAGYMVMGLMPTLAEQVLEGMDVEALTHELQQKSRTVKAGARDNAVQPPAQIAPPPAPPPNASLADSVMSSAEMVDRPASEPDARSESDLGVSGSLVSYPGHDRGSPSGSSLASQPDLSKSSQSWVDEFGSQSLVSVPAGHGPFQTSVIMPAPPSAPSEPPTSLSSSVSSLPSSAPSLGSRTKAELWNEVKILTFTRTLTVLYSTTLLALFTHVQLSVLGRLKYVQSVFELAREERSMDAFGLGSIGALGAQLGLPDLGLVFNGGGFGSALDTEPDGLGGDGENEAWEKSRGAGGVPSETEMQYLSLSWWLLHVGWKDVGERVRRAVEEVFDEVSLKEKLSPMDLHRLLNDVRRRVEHEITFEGKERRINFLSSLLPPTPDTLHQVLTKAGLSVAPPPHLHLPAFHYTPPASSALQPGTNEEGGALGALLEETRSRLGSPDFAVVLGAALEAAADVLSAGLLHNVFPQGAEGEEVPEEEARVRLAGMLPGMARWSKLALTGLPNELVDRLAEVPEVGTYSAIIFSAFEENFR